MINCWGVLQTALIATTLKDVPISTTSFIGGVMVGMGGACSLLSLRVARRYGLRTTVIVGVLLMGFGALAGSWCTHSVPGLFITIGFLVGMGNSFVYNVTNALPVQYFSGKLGLANGLIKLGGGVGGTIMAIALEALSRRVGVAWTFRIQGLMTLASGLPAAWLMKERVGLRNTPSFDTSMFKSVPYSTMFAAGAVGTFALFVPPYYLPLFAQSIKLSSSTGAALVAAFNACTALGRFIGGPACDKIGAMNTFVIAMALNAITMLGIWPVSSTVAPLFIFATVNGVANGAFFTVFPTVAASIFGPGRAIVAMTMTITGLTPGYLLGAPIAGFLLQAAGGSKQGGTVLGVAAYRPAIFYAGGTALISCVLGIVARMIHAKGKGKKV